MAPFKGAHGITVADGFHIGDLSSKISSIINNLSRLKIWCTFSPKEISVTRSFRVIHRSQGPNGILQIQLTAVGLDTSVFDLEIISACTIPLPGCIHHTAVAKVVIGPIIISFQLTCLSHARPPLEHHLATSTSKIEASRLFLESFQRPFANKLIGYSLLMPQKDRWFLPDIGKLRLWISRPKFCILYRFLHSLAVHNGLFKTWPDCRQITHVRPYLIYFPITFTHTRKTDRSAVENVQLAFNRTPVGPHLA